MPTPLRLLLGFCLVAPGAWAAAPHPSMLTVKYGDQFLPVVKVRGDTPYVMLDGKERDIRTNPLYLLQDAPGYSDNYVTAPTCALSGEFQLGAAVETNVPVRTQFQHDGFGGRHRQCGRRRGPIRQGDAA